MTEHLTASHPPPWRAAMTGFTDILPMLAGAAPFAMLLGSIAIERGLTPAEVTLMSATVYAGAAQFIAIDIWTSPVPVVVLIFTTFLVNMRHMLMGAALVPHLRPLPKWQRIAFVSIHTDESWAVALKRAASTPLTTAYLVGMAVPFYVQWPIMTYVGAKIGALMGDPAQYGFDFVFTAVFLSLVTGFWKAQSKRVLVSVAILASAGAGMAAWALLPGVWYILAGGIAGMISTALLWRPEMEGER